MTKDLLDAIYAQLSKAVSATTSTNIYYRNLPNEELLKTFNVIYSVNLTDNVNTFNQIGYLKTFQIDIKVLNPTTDKILLNKVFIDSKIKLLPSINAYIKYVSLTSEDLSFDYDLQTNLGELKYSLQYSQY